MSESPESWLDLANNALTGYLDGVRDKLASLDDARLDALLNALHLIERNAHAAILATCNVQLDRQGVTASIRDEVMYARRHGLPASKTVAFIKKVLEENGVDANPTWVAKKLGV